MIISFQSEKSAMSIFTLFGNYQTYNNDALPGLAGAVPAFHIGAKAATTAAVTYAVPGNFSGSSKGLMIVPDPSILPYAVQDGTSGVLTHLSFTATGSLQGGTVSVEERSGIFAYGSEYRQVGAKFTADFQADNFYNDQSFNLAVAQANNDLFLHPNGNAASEFEALSNRVAQVEGATPLYADLVALSQIAAKWSTPTYYLDTGAGPVQVSTSNINYGIEKFTTPTGATTTFYTLPGNTGPYGVVVQGYTAVAHATATDDRYDIFPALTNGHIDIAFDAPIAATNISKVMHGVTISGTQAANLSNFVQNQYQYGHAIHVDDATVYAYSMMGLTLAESGPSGSSAFAAIWGPRSMSHANETLFVNDAYFQIFGNGIPATQHFLDQLHYLEKVLPATGNYGTDPVRIELFARGVVFGQMLGMAAESDNAHALSAPAIFLPQTVSVVGTAESVGGASLI